MKNHHRQIPGYADTPILVHHYNTLESTNSKAKQLALENASEWTVVFADEQTKGRGRYQRQWHSPAGLGIYFSIILRPKLDLPLLNMINLRAALVMREMIQTKLEQVEPSAAHLVEVKWPNDVLVEKRKICGILLESEIVNQTLNHLILGIGLNLNHQRLDFPNELLDMATSLKILTKLDWECPLFLDETLQNLQRQIIMDMETGFENVIIQYQKYLAYKEQVVNIKLHDQTLNGRIRGIDSYGSLLLEQENKIRKITAGDISFS